MRGDHSGFGKLVFRQDIRVPPCQCPQTGSPIAHHCILSSRSMSEYGLIRSRGFCAFFFLGMGMKPRLISLFLSRLCLADLAILQPSLIVFWKEPAPLFAAMSSDAPFGYSRPGGRGAGSRQFNPFRCRCFSGDRHYRLILRAFCGMDVPPGMRRLLSVTSRLPCSVRYTGGSAGERIRPSAHMPQGYGCRMSAYPT